MILKKSENYLDYIPYKNPEFTWTEKKDGNVEIAVIHKGIFAKIAQSVFLKPKKSYIKLDSYGSFLWRQIDGEHTVYKLSVLMSDEFGEKAEPLIPRLLQFMKILQTNHYIYYKGEKNK